MDDRHRNAADQRHEQERAPSPVASKPLHAAPPALPDARVRDRHARSNDQSAEHERYIPIERHPHTQLLDQSPHDRPCNAPSDRAPHTQFAILILPVTQQFENRVVHQGHNRRTEKGEQSYNRQQQPELGDHREHQCHYHHTADGEPKQSLVLLGRIGHTPPQRGPCQRHQRGQPGKHADLVARQPQSLITQHQKRRKRSHRGIVQKVKGLRQSQVSALSHQAAQKSNRLRRCRRIVILVHVKRQATHKSNVVQRL